MATAYTNSPASDQPVAGAEIWLVIAAENGNPIAQVNYAYTLQVDTALAISQELYFGPSVL